MEWVLCDYESTVGYKFFTPKISNRKALAEV